MSQKSHTSVHRRSKRWVLAVLFIALLVLVAYLIFTSIRIKSVTISGTNRYSAEEMEDILFSGKWDYRSIYSYVKFNWLEKEEIPFVEAYEVYFIDMNTVEIVVYEKSVVGYIKYMDNCMYFDKDGIVVESSEEVMEGVPLITGLDFNRIVLNQPIPVEDKDVFNEILSLTQLLYTYEIDVDKIYFDSSMNSVLYIGELKVELGNNSYMQDKISNLKDIIPNLEGKAGTLKLSGYDPAEENASYPFKPQVQDTQESIGN